MNKQKSKSMKAWHDENTHGEVEVLTQQVIIKKIKCPYCKSINTVKHGFVMTPKKRRYLCKDCERHFTQT